ncbi:MAG: hypothetical protein H7Y04_05380 [Verrucomicrobia bacterium]|nr:hypothetical protein [Cytophagales bacterium]
MRVVIGDEKEAEGSGTSVTLKVALRNYSNYYAFGMEMPGGSWSSSTYRYACNDKEKDTDFQNNYFCK